MTKTDWRNQLRGCFEDIAILERCRMETAENFRQFCEFIAEPAIEALEEELKTYEIRAKHSISKGRSISLQVDFPRSKTDHFHYAIVLPKNSVELKLQARVRGRREPNGPLLESLEPFMPGILPDKVMKITREDLISAVIARYRDFIIESMSGGDG
ncbi:MAG: hypothetical protein A2W03_17505 [Candidatus Aminicenantes bacterium RBG_16_63_16]|nr:MAG: hypothetical protein A2W03_17505 [Candidatus Aminicenantes bacterium RBG_16_63_16]